MSLPHHYPDVVSLASPCVALLQLGPGTMRWPGDELIGEALHEYERAEVVYMSMSWAVFVPSTMSYHLS